MIAPEGWPEFGARVTSSAGGSAVTEADGSFRLELALPSAAHCLELTVDDAGLSPERRSTKLVDIGLPGTINQAGVITLPRGGGCAPSWRPTFGMHPGFELARIEAMTSFDDGTGGGTELFVGGRLMIVNGGDGCVYKWNGSWQRLPLGWWNTIHAFASFDDGGGPELYLAGDIDSLDHIARWDGQSFSPLGAGLSGAVEALAVFDDGTGPALFAGGVFLSAGGAAANRIARWDGSGWSALGGGVDGAVRALTVFDDGNGDGPALYVGGSFTTAGSLVARHVARWDGTAWSQVGSGMQGPPPDPSFVSTLQVHDDGLGGGPALYAGGRFESAGGVPARNIARWDGNAWAPVGSGVARHPFVLSTFDDGAGGGPVLVAGGDFIEAGGTTANHVARWDGTSWSALDTGMNDTVTAFGVLDDGTGAALFAGGRFRIASGLGVNHFTRWDGNRWQPVGSGLHEAVYSLEVAGDHRGRGLPALHVGGSFTSTGLVEAAGIARWRQDWSALADGLERSDGAGSAWDMVEFDDDGDGFPALFVGGYFSEAGGVSAANVARWNGGTWSPLGAGLDGIVWKLALFDDGDGPTLYAGGTFSGTGDDRLHQIARWDGSSWSDPGGGLWGSVNALAVFDDGDGPDLYAGGRFVRGGVDGATTLSRIARWDGNAWSDLAGGIPGGTSDVQALLVHDDGSGPALYVGGAFPGAGGVTSPNLVRWDGTSWSTVGGPNSSVHGLASFDDGSGRDSLFAAGDFTSVAGLASQRIARWDGARWSALGSGLSGGVLDLAVFDDGGGPALFVGGSFASAFDSGDSFLACWQGCPDLEPPALVCPGGLSVADSGAPGEVVEFTVTATDTRDPFPVVVCVPPSGSLFPPGTTLVTCKARDAAGNQAECAFPVIIGGRFAAR